MSLRPCPDAGDSASSRRRACPAACLLAVLLGLTAHGPTLALAGSTQAATTPRRPARLQVCPRGSLPGTPPPVARATVAVPKKRAWEATFGGEEQARPHLQQRLAGWPERLLTNPENLPTAEHDFAQRLARDTWKGLAAFTDRENGLPVDVVRFADASVAAAAARVGDYASSTDIGLHLVAVVAAYDLQFISRDQALDRIRRVLTTLQSLERYRGFFFNYYDTTSLERTSNFVSFVDSSWLTAGLIVVRTAFPELAETCTRLIEQTDYGFLYDRDVEQVAHGYYVDPGRRSPYDYGMLYTEARLGSLIAIGKGDVPQAHWFAMLRTLPDDCGGQTQRPQGVTAKVVDGHELTGGYYQWGGLRYVPSWGGSMFEALMPTLLLDEVRYAPTSLGANDRTHAVVQQRYAAEELGYGVWGFSSSAVPGGGGYSEYGVRVLGVRGYDGGVVAPYAAALALGVTPAAALADLRALAQRYAIYGEYGFYDAVDPRSAAVAYSYLALDQSMLFIALANYLDDHRLQQRFASDPIIQNVLPLIGNEDFFH